MNTFLFSTYLTTNADLDPDIVKSIIADQKKLYVEKGNFLLQEGEICKNSFYVEIPMDNRYDLVGYLR